MSSIVSTDGQSAFKATRREWIGLAVIALPCMLAAIDRTVLHLAMPRISAELHPSSLQLLWMMDIYGFFLAGLLITMGTLGDRIGRRRLLLVGAAAFGVASVIAASATSIAVLIAARALLGIGGAVLAPSTLSLIRHMFIDPRERTWAIGVWATSYSVGGAIGPLIGGLFLQQFGWASVFWIGVPVMILLLALGPRLLPEYKNPNAAPMDLISAAQSLGAVLSLMYGFKEIAAHGFHWAATASVLLGAAICVIFVRRQRELEKPLIDLSLLRSSRFSTALMVFTLGCFVASGLSLFTSQYLQLVLDLSPLHAGLWTLPSVLGFVIGSLLTSVIMRWNASMSTMSGGLLIAAIGLGIVGQVNQATHVEVLAGGLFLFSLGLAPVLNQAIGVMVGAAPRERSGEASAISETGSELGAALGIAVLGSIGTVVYRGAVASSMPLEAVPVAEQIPTDTLGHAIALAAQLPADAAARWLNVVRTAFDSSLDVVVTLCAAIVMAMAVAVLVASRARSSTLLQHQDERVDESGQ